MSIHSFHLAPARPRVVIGALLSAPSRASVPGLRHAESLAVMRLGAPTVSPARMQLRRLAMFAEWDDEVALQAFLDSSKLGAELARGWHVRLEFLRQWGSLGRVARSAAGGPAVGPGGSGRRRHAGQDEAPPAVQIPAWGKPVERLVRDHPGASLALAAMRPPRTICTFSVWRSQREMVEMVHGRSDVPDAARHAAAMAERSRHDFHHEFTTLRFRALSEHGRWRGRSAIVPLRDRGDGGDGGDGPG